MEYETNMKENFILLRYAAAGSTLIAGILHLTLVANAIDRNFNTGILFLIGGLAQVFWVLPTIRGWNKVWYYVGIGGTLTLILIWAITRVPGNPINGRGGFDRRNSNCNRSISSSFYCPEHNYLMERSKGRQINILNWSNDQNLVW